MKNRRATWPALTLTLLLFAAGTHAEESPADAPEPSGAPQKFNLWINGGLLSYHFDRNADFRGKNWGFGVQSDLTPEISVQAGDFINSNHVRSDYAGAAWQPISWHGARIGVAAGAFNGYPAMRNGGWFLAALPWVSIRNERFGVNLTLIPNYSNRLRAAASAQFILRVW